MGVARGVRGAALLLGRRVGGCAEAVAHPWRWASSGLELSSAWGPCGASCCGSSEMSHAIPPACISRFDITSLELQRFGVL